MAKKFNYFFILGFFLFIGYSAIHFEKPVPVQLYANNFKHLVCKELNRAKSSIDLVTYGLSDPEILALLDKKKTAGLHVSALCDARSSPRHPLLTRVKKSGLNHAKIAIIDDHLTYLGSANFTSTSLELHHNCMLGIDSKEVAQFYKQAIKNTIGGHLSWKNLDLYMLPEKTALNAVLQLLDEAKDTIQVAMFTLSHPKIIEKLEHAQKRGVNVKVIIDRYTKQPKTELSLCHAEGPALLHHKWALIDHKHLIVGSTNWTKAGFTKNFEAFAILRDLSDCELKTCKMLWKTLI